MGKILLCNMQLNSLRRPSTAEDEYMTIMIMMTTIIRMFMMHMVFDTATLYNIYLKERGRYCTKHESAE